MARIVLCFLIAAAVSFGCAGRELAHEQLHAVLWVQSAAEYKGLAIQSYAHAEAMLDEALSDPTWTAAVEQTGDRGDPVDYDELPPAIILDVDETVLDNSDYQARLILEGEGYSTESWLEWCREVRARAIPGAVSFTQMAAERGVEVFYVTNRRHVVEPATRENLSVLKFPLSESRDTILTRGERKSWGSDKTTRRELVASDYRILLLVGDNLGDFLGEVDKTPERRNAMMERYRDFWGTRWIVLANPQYGSWEQSLLGDGSRQREDALRTKRKALRSR